jgi:nucleotide-binding universal stress UspA family protein
MTVLVAYIHTPEGEAALTAAVNEARWRATNAMVVNVTRPAAEVDSPLSAEQGLDAAAALFEEAGVEVEVRQLPPSSDRAGDILALMSEVQPELVVIGMRKRSHVGELVVGSNSQRILRGPADRPGPEAAMAPSGGAVTLLVRVDGSGAHTTKAGHQLGQVERRNSAGDHQRNGHRRPTLGVAASPCPAPEVPDQQRGEREDHEGRQSRGERGPGRRALVTAVTQCDQQRLTGHESSRERRDEQAE